MTKLKWNKPREISIDERLDCYISMGRLKRKKFSYRNNLKKRIVRLLSLLSKEKNERLSVYLNEALERLTRGSVLTYKQEELIAKLSKKYS